MAQRIQNGFNQMIIVARDLSHCPSNGLTEGSYRWVRRLTGLRRPYGVGCQISSWAVSRADTLVAGSDRAGTASWWVELDGVPARAGRWHVGLRLSHGGDGRADPAVRGPC